MLVKITGSFKAIWVKKGEDEKTGEHLSIVAKTVRAPKARVVEYLAQKEEILVQKLRDKYHESWENIEQNTRDLLVFGHSGTAKRHGGALLLALETSCGSRKGEFLDPNVTFMTYECRDRTWKKKKSVFWKSKSLEKTS